MNSRIPLAFYRKDVLEVAPNILGKTLCRKFSDSEISRFIITEVEAYKGITDLACHASKGKTSRTRIMFDQGGFIYIYLIYGMYWLLNIVTGQTNDASAILIRGLNEISGPGRVGKTLQLDKTFYGENIFTSDRIWIENTPIEGNIITSPRINIDYAGEPWISKPWRYQLII